MKQVFFRILFCVGFFFLGSSVSAQVTEVHPVEKGETALEIAINNHLTMDQLQQLNPGVDLEMMRVGDPLILPKEGYDHFEDFLADFYAETLEISQCTCAAAADESAQCLYRLKNIGETTLYNVAFNLTSEGRSQSSQTALVQLLPGEELPGYVGISGVFSSSPDCKLSLTSLDSGNIGGATFRIPADSFEEHHQFLAGDICAEVTLNFTPQYAAEYARGSLNILSAAYAQDGTLIGARSFYGDFITPLKLTVCAIGGRSISEIRTFAEAYLL